jgi:hypothetical protein
MMASIKQAWPLLRQLQTMRDRYRVHTAVAVAVVASLFVFVAPFIPAFATYVYSYVTLLIVLDIAAVMEVRRDVRFVANQDESADELLSAVAGCRQADLIEYAGATTLPLIRCIQRENVPMRLLVKHPDTVDGLQRQRMITTLDTLYNSIFAGQTGKYEIRCYRLPYSLRGRHLHGRIIELGWLTPDPERQTAFGHANPSALVTVPGTPKEYLKEFFDRTFNIYWEHNETEDGLAVLTRLQARPEASAASPGLP